MYYRVLNKKGFTLIELVMAIVIASIAISMLLLVASESTRRSVDPMIQEQGSALAQAYLEEIMQKSFCDPDLATDCVAACTAAPSPACGNVACTSAEGPANRDIFDDVCDYDNRSDNPPQDILGTPITALDQYTVTVDIVDDNSANLNGLAGDQGEVVRIDVTVSHPSMQTDVELSGFRANF